MCWRWAVWLLQCCEIRPAIYPQKKGKFWKSSWAQTLFCNRLHEGKATWNPLEPSGHDRHRAVFGTGPFLGLSPNVLFYNMFLIKYLPGLKPKKMDFTLSEVEVTLWSPSLRHKDPNSFTLIYECWGEECLIQIWIFNTIFMTCHMYGIFYEMH